MNPIRFASKFFDANRSMGYFTLLGGAALIAGTITASHATQAGLAAGHPGLVPPSPAQFHASRVLESRELQQIREAAQERVRALAANLRSLPEGPESRTIQQHIAETKRHAYVRHLEVILASARAHGDETTAREAEKMLAHLNRPPQPATGSEDFIQGPDKNTP